MALNYSRRKEFEEKFYMERDNGYNRVQPFLGGNCSSKKNRDTRVNAKVFPFRGDEKKKERKERKGEIGGSFSFISPTPRFENLKTRRGVAQVRIAQTQSTHQSRGTDAYRWARVFSIFDERSFSKRVYNRRSAGKGITGKGKTVN